MLAMWQPCCLAKLHRFCALLDKAVPRVYLFHPSEPSEPTEKNLLLICFMISVGFEGLPETSKQSRFRAGRKIRFGRVRRKRRHTFLLVSCSLLDLHLYLTIIQLIF